MPSPHIYGKHFLDTGKQYSTDTLTNSEDQDEGSNFHQGLHKINAIFSDRKTSNFDWAPLKIQNGLFHICCINMYGIIHQNEKG